MRVIFLWVLSTPLLSLHFPLLHFRCSISVASAAVVVCRYVFAVHSFPFLFTQLTLSHPKTHWTSSATSTAATTTSRDIAHVQETPALTKKNKTERKKWKPMAVGVQVLGSTVNSHKCFVYVYNLAAAAAPADVAFAFDIALAAAVALLHCRCCSVFLPQFVTPLMLLTWLLQHASPLLSSRTA